MTRKIIITILDSGEVSQDFYVRLGNLLGEYNVRYTHETKKL